VNKAAESATLSAKCILLHAYSRTTVIVSSCARTNKNFIYSFLQTGITVFWL